jgi:hypothetical protein
MTEAELEPEYWISSHRDVGLNKFFFKQNLTNHSVGLLRKLTRRVLAKESVDYLKPDRILSYMEPIRVLYTGDHSSKLDYISRLSSRLDVIKQSQAPFPEQTTVESKQRIDSMIHTLLARIRIRADVEHHYGEDHLMTYISLLENQLMDFELCRLGFPCIVCIFGIDLFGIQGECANDPDAYSSQMESTT